MKAKMIALALLSACSLAMAEAPATEQAQTLASQGSSSARGAALPQEVSKETPKRGNGIRTPRRAAVESARINQDFYVFDAFVNIRDDFDFDGFFTRVELTFDVDTIYNSADVFAVLYLSLEGGPWTEYGSTEDFRIFGTSGGDEYFYDADLVSGFPTGYYDVLIEIYDAFDGRFVAEFGPAESAELFDLPLESISLDGPNEPVVVVSNEGGGATGVAGLALLMGLLGLARRRGRIETLYVAD
ncbi:MAG: choice-of-anchor H family protein [Pseudomonadota bacterium]